MPQWTRLLDKLRDLAYQAITTPDDGRGAPVRISKDLARRLNATLGRPLAPRDERERRAAARRRLAELRGRGASAGASPRATAAPPVLVYFETGRNARMLTRIEELLQSKSIVWKRLDVTGDEATIEFVTRRASCERDDLPVVFVADEAIGGYEALVRADVKGDLERRLRGEPPSALDGADERPEAGA